MTIVAVTKTRTPQQIQEVLAAGVPIIGRYLPEQGNPWDVLTSACDGPVLSPEIHSPENVPEPLYPQYIWKTEILLSRHRIGCVKVKI